jgi:hypothetical protein
MEEMKVMKKRFVLIAALVAALAMVLFTGCPTSVEAASREGTFPPPAPADFADAEGMTTGIAVQGNAVFDDDTGIIDCTSTESKLFTITLPAATTVAGTKKVKIEYICWIIEGEGKVTVKKGGTWNTIDDGDATDAEKYPSLVNLDVTTYELGEKFLPAGATSISFQTNGNEQLFYLKILSVKLE